ncbi:MAG TPA: hypothetical protein VH062_34080 [Polyangiaceae bacterium]|jgi:hypothetical protein|nr:hypothetical protein [Polyangiaceae bacterium]
MPSEIKKFLFTKPKTVKSGSSIQLNVTVSVVGPPKVLKLEPSAGYTCDPESRTYDTAGTQDDSFFVTLTGDAGVCVLQGTLGASQDEDAAEVT